MCHSLTLDAHQPARNTVPMNSIIGKLGSTLRPLKLPLFAAQIPAGFPSPAMDHLHNPVDLHERLIHNAESTFFVRVSGDSMRDAGIVESWT